MAPITHPSGRTALAVQRRHFSLDSARGQA